MPVTSYYNVLSCITNQVLPFLLRKITAWEVTRYYSLLFLKPTFVMTLKLCCQSCWVYLFKPFIVSHKVEGRYKVVPTVPEHQEQISNVWPRDDTDYKGIFPRPLNLPTSQSACYTHSTVTKTKRTECIFYCICKEFFLNFRVISY